MVRIVNEPGMAALWGSALGETVGSGTESLITAFQERKKQQKESELLKRMMNQYSTMSGTPIENLAGLDAKDMKSLQRDYVKSYPKEQKDRLEQQEGLSRTMDQLNSTIELSGMTLPTDPYLRKALQSSAQSKVRSNLKALSKNKYLRDKGIPLPEADIGSEFIPMMKQVMSQLQSEYGMQQPEQPEDKQPPQPVEFPKDQFGRPEMSPDQIAQQLPQQQPQPDSTGMQVARAIPQVASELLRAGTPVGQIADAVHGALDFRQSALPSRNELEEVLQNVPPSMRDQIMRSYEEMSGPTVKAYDKEFKIQDWLPSSKNREKLVDYVTDKAFGDRPSKEKSETEKYITRLASAAGTRNLFTGRSLFSPKDIAKSASNVLFSEAGGAAAESAGLGKSGRFIASTGLSMMADPLFGKLRETVYDNAGKVFNKVEPAISNLTSKSTKLSDITKEASHTLQKYKNIPPELSQYAEDINKQAQFGAMNLGEARDYVKGMNSWYYGGGKKLIGKGVGDTIFHSIRGELENVIETGMKQNGLSSLYKEYIYAKDITKGIKSAEFGINNLKKGIDSGKNAGKSLWRILAQAAPEAGTGAVIGGLAGSAIPGGSIPGAIAGGAVGLGVNTLKNAYKFLNIPTAKKEFLKMLPALLAGNMPVVEKQTGILASMFDKQNDK